MPLSLLASGPKVKSDSVLVHCSEFRDSVNGILSSDSELVQLLLVRGSALLLNVPVVGQVH